MEALIDKTPTGIAPANPAGWENASKPGVGDPQPLTPIPRGPTARTATVVKEKSTLLREVPQPALAMLVVRKAPVTAESTAVDPP